MKEFNFYALKVVKEKSVRYEPMHSAESVAEFFQKMIGDDAEEHMLVAGCDTKGAPICFFELAHGDINSAIVSPAALFKRLFACNCAAFFICHNHPSSILEWSKEDIACNAKLKKIGDLLGVRLIDSFLVSDDDWVSAFSDGVL